MSRAQAEEYYKEYLLQSDNREQKARVLVILGRLYSTSARPQYGEPTDRGRASEYFRQAIEEDPDGISRELIGARSHLMGFVAGRKERLSAHLDFIQYLSNLSQEDIEKRCRPMTPSGDRKYSAEETAKYIKLSKPIAQANALELAGNTPLPAVVEGDVTSDIMLREIIRRFPNTAFAERAQSKLNELNKARIEHDEAFVGIDGRPIADMSKSEALEVDSTSRGHVQARGSHQGRAAILIGGILTVLVVVAVFALKRRHAKNLAKKRT